MPSGAYTIGACKTGIFNGLVIIPIAAVLIGGIIPQPPGLPTLTIGPDNVATDTDPEPTQATNSKAPPTSIVASYTKPSLNAKDLAASVPAFTTAPPPAVATGTPGPTPGVSGAPNLPLLPDVDGHLTCESVVDPYGNNGYFYQNGNTFSLNQAFSAIDSFCNDQIRAKQAVGVAGQHPSENGNVAAIPLVIESTEGLLFRMQYDVDNKNPFDAKCPDGQLIYFGTSEPGAALLNCQQLILSTVHSELRRKEPPCSDDDTNCPHLPRHAEAEPPNPIPRHRHQHPQLAREAAIGVYPHRSRSRRPEPQRATRARRKAALKAADPYPHAPPQAAVRRARPILDMDAPHMLQRRLRTVDFVSLATERELDSPPLLLRSICHGVDPAKPRTLALDNLHDLGQARDGHDLPRASDLSTMTETDCVDGTPMLRHPGPTRGCLQPLIGRCTALQHLSLRSVGQDDVHDALWSPAKDEARYAEAAEFIASVRPTLRTLVFEQGLQADDDSDPGCGSSRAGLSTREAGRPMDVRFVKYIVPVLVEAPWPHLREMVIRGVGGSVRRSVERGNREMDRTLAEEIYGIVHGAMSEQNIRLSWEREASKTFYLRVHDLRYD
ncbi:hypothetical protein MMC11_006173 [Xylographa trunciseda]|nr:hypothetical protein [Xylographa trunciseda]